MTQIPILDLGPEIKAIKNQLNAALDRVLDQMQFIGGPEVETFEKEVAAYLGASHAIACNSGTDALVMALRALGIQEGDEVITTPFTFFATVEAIGHCRATPVLVDIEAETFILNLDLVEAAITDKTKAIIPVHLFGQSCDMDRLTSLAQRHGVHVIEDVAQAFGGSFKGNKLGTMGAVGCYSFFPSKNLGCFGDGGLMTTEDAKVADTLRKLRAHGGKNKYHNEMLGYNSRLDAIQAAFLQCKLPRIDSANSGRKQAAIRYGELLSGIPGVEVPRVAPDCEHVFHQYTVRIAHNRDQVQERLSSKGVQTMVYYPTPVHQLPLYQHWGLNFPEAERAAAQVLSLPIWPEISEDVQRTVASALKEAIAEVGH